MSSVRLTRRGEAVVAAAALLSFLGFTAGMALAVCAWWGLL